MTQWRCSPKKHSQRTGPGSDIDSNSCHTYRGELASGTHLELAQREEEQALDAALKLFMEKKMASGVM